MENTDLKNVLEYCENEKIYFGEGTATARILFIGKEAGWNESMPKPDKIENIKLQEKCSVEHNLNCWQNGNGCLEQLKKDALKPKKKGGWPNSPTWRSYQFLIKEITGKKDISKNSYDFLDHSFITELSQIPLPYSNFIKEKSKTEIGWDDNIRKESVQKREELFHKNSFFQNFSIVIMACGHYPTREFNKKMYEKYTFDIGKVFNSTFEKKITYKDDEKLLKGNWFDVYRGKTKNGKNKILIHTRQVSMGISTYALLKIAELCKEIYKLED
ncbi:MAG: hypothetical protein LBR55_06735 [Bacteroidales bacterium]|jgi:hypothetical protein|nr:hypothetical protein [Bacteroidales bacterium]